MVCKNHGNSDWGHLGQSVETIDLLCCWKLHLQVVLSELCDILICSCLYEYGFLYMCSCALYSEVSYGFDTICDRVVNDMLTILSNGFYNSLNKMCLYTVYIILLNPKVLHNAFIIAGFKGFISDFIHNYSQLLEALCFQTMGYRKHGIDLF